MNLHNRGMIFTWRANVDLKPVLSKNTAISYIAKYASKAESGAPEFSAMLSNIVSNTLRNPKQEQLPENEEDEDEEITPDPDEMLMEEADWQLYAHLFPNAALPTFDASDLGHRPVDQGWDVDEARARWANVDRMASYIADQRREAAEEVESNDDMAAPIDVETLEQEQLAVFQRFIETYTKILQQEPVEPMQLNIDGTTGCGKTYLIRAICQELRRMAIDHGCLDPIRVLAPSGVAVWNINGRTIHSALSIPATNSSAFPPLMGTRLATLQQQFNGVHFLIVDEKSMVGQRMLPKVDSRLCQLKSQDTPSSGKNNITR
ncbi:hypothetical protein V8D89_000719 [Ganoderma adspersum]